MVHMNSHKYGSVHSTLSEMNAAKLRQFVNAETVAVLIFGACENHGDHMPFGSDFILRMREKSCH
jgi:creatinine amidohydrolase/Fe(II)-dependent formamide hydrolase-like protein